MRQSALKEPFEIVDIPAPSEHNSKWAIILNAIPADKAMLYTFNNRQRIHQIAATIRSTASHFKMGIATRIYHGIPEIHGTDKWLLYIWRKKDGGELK